MLGVKGRRELQPAHEIEFVTTAVIDPFSIAERLLKVFSDLGDRLLRKIRYSRMIFIHFLLCQ